MSTIPFDPPKLLTARRITGFVNVPETTCSSATPFGESNSNLVDFTSEEPEKTLLAAPTQLRRTNTMNGNILIVEEDGKPSRAFWLQRKVNQLTHGTVRLGFSLQPNTNPEFAESGGTWELLTPPETDGGHHKMVQIEMLDTMILDMKLSADEASSVVRSPLHEICALQMVADHKDTTTRDAHVVGSKLVATTPEHVFVVMPYHRDGTLFQYCLTKGSLEEPVARFFFRQILKGLKTLREVGLCHRNISLATVELDGEHLDITGLGGSLRYSQKATDKAPPPPGNSNPQYIPPEFFHNSDDAGSCWDGFAGDLWACGLMLYSMVASTQALFAAPVSEDRLFGELCVKGNIGEQAEKHGKVTGKDIKLSDGLIDLLRQMMKADPSDRLSLKMVTEHKWVTDGEVTVPPELMASKGK